MSYKGFQAAQEKYDNMCPPEFDDYEDDTESEEDSGSSNLENNKEPKEKDDNFNIDEYEDQQQVLAVQRDYERFLNWLYK